jgi:hypothetical protein
LLVSNLDFGVSDSGTKRTENWIRFRIGGRRVCTRKFYSLFWKVLP